MAVVYFHESEPPSMGTLPEVPGSPQLFELLLTSPPDVRILKNPIKSAYSQTIPADLGQFFQET